MFNEGTLDTEELMLVVCEEMRDGSKYTGQVLRSSKYAWYKNNLKKLYIQHGWGTSRWPNGAKYQGKWSNGEANGQGVYTFKCGASVKTTFCNNKAQGDAVLIGMRGPEQIETVK